MIKKIFLSFFIVLTSSCINNNYNKNRYFQFIYEVQIEPTNGKKLELWIPVPQTNEVQKISQLKFELDSLNFELKTENKHKNKYLYIYSNTGTVKHKNIKMLFNVLRKEHNNVEYENVNPNNYITSYSQVPIGNVFLDVINENNLEKYNMREIYNFVINGMHYGKPKDSTLDDVYYAGKNPKTNTDWLPQNEKFGRLEVDKKEVVNFYKDSKINNEKYTFGNGNSLYACDIGVGNCTDFHSYFMSIGRTLEVPVRFHMGFPIPNGKSGKIEGYHCWADYYVDEKGWYPVDISEADKDPNRLNYFFGTVCENRVELIVGRDFKLDNYEEERVNLFIYPLLEINDEKSTAYTKKFSYKNL